MQSSQKHVMLDLFKSHTIIRRYVLYPEVLFNFYVWSISNLRDIQLKQWHLAS